MITRRDLLRIAAVIIAGNGLSGIAGMRRALAQQALRQDDLLRFDSKGQFTILHLADVHAQLKPLYYREPSLNLGVGDARGRLPHLTGAELINALAISDASPEAYMLSSDDFEALAKT